MEIHIDQLLAHQTKDLWELLDGKFTVVFPDGKLETDRGHTVYSSYAWDLVREFPVIQLYTSNHLTGLLKDTSFSASSNERLIGNLIRRIFLYYREHGEAFAALSERLGMPMNRQELKGYLSGRAFEVVNNIYNDFTYALEPYVVTLKAEDFMEILEYPSIAKILSEPDYTETHVQNVYDVVAEELIHAPNRYERKGGERPVAYDNAISRLARSKVSDPNQLYQVSGVRGLITDIDSAQFPIPILRNLTNGIRSFHDSLIESRSASKALAFSTTPLQQTEYFNRRLQLTTLNLRDLDEGDCGSTQYMDWKVHPKDLPLLVGKYYMHEDGLLRIIQAKDEHLVGQTLQLRTVGKCQSVNPQGVCETCFGELSFAVYRDTNLGWVCSTHLCRIISQAVLSTKHLDGSSTIEPIELDAYGMDYFRINRDGDGYLISPDMDLKNVKLLIRPEMAPGMTDVMEVDDVRKLGPSRVTSIDRVRFDTYNDKNQVIDQAELDVGMIRRPASFTFEMLQYIHEQGFARDANGNYVIDLSKWDARRVIMTVPHRHFNMSDLSKQIEQCLEAVTQARVIKERDTETRWEGFVAELFYLVNSRLKVNLAILEVIAYCVMIQSAGENEYSFPKPWTRNAFGVQSRTINLRSEAPALAFEKQLSLIVNPLSFNKTNRMDHPLDVFIDPVGVLAEYKRRENVNRHVTPVSFTPYVKEEQG